MPGKLLSIVRQEDNSDLEQWVAETLGLARGTFALTDAAVLYTVARYAELRDMREVQRDMFGAFLRTAARVGVPRSDLCSVDVYMARGANAAHRQAVCYALRALAERIHGSPHLLSPPPPSNSLYQSSTETPSGGHSSSNSSCTSDTKQEEATAVQDKQQEQQEQEQEKEKEQQEKEKKKACEEDMEEVLKWLAEQDQEVLSKNAVVLQKTWRMHVARAAYQARQRDVRARRAVVLELVDTEEAYVHSLQECVRVYVEPMTRWVRQGAGAAAGVSEQDIRTIFGDLGVVIKLNAFFLERLLPLRRAFGPHTRVAAQVRGIVDFLPLYSQYVVHYAAAMAHYNRLMAASSAFAALEQRCRLSALNSKNYDMESFLVQPVQRVPRYILLLRELLKHTPSDHPDHAGLVQALERAQRVAELLNTRRRQGENASEYARLRGVVTGLPRDTPFCVPHRRLVRYQGVRGETGKPLLLLLFSDCLMVFADARKTKFLCHIPLADLSLLPLGPTELQIARSHDQQVFDIVSFLSGPVRSDFLDARQKLCDEIAREQQHQNEGSGGSGVATTSTASTASASASSSASVTHQDLPKSVSVVGRGCVPALGSPRVVPVPRPLTNAEYVDRVKNYQLLGADRDELARAVADLKAELDAATAENDAARQHALQARLDAAQAQLVAADTQRARIQSELAAPAPPDTHVAHSVIVLGARGTSTPSTTSNTSNSTTNSASTGKRSAHAASASTAPSPVATPHRVLRRAGSTSDAVRLDELLQQRATLHAVGTALDTPPSPSSAAATAGGSKCLIPTAPGTLVPSRPAPAPPAPGSPLLPRVGTSAPPSPVCTPLRAASAGPVPGSPRTPIRRPVPHSSPGAHA